MIVLPPQRKLPHKTYVAQITATTTIVTKAVATK